jgi:ribosomal protein S18 acetylase RimI-like enzyme
MGTAPALAGMRFVEAGVLLLRRWLAECQRRGLRALQILVEDSSPVLRRVLRQAGFKRLTSLLYMLCPTDQDLPTAVTAWNSATKGHSFHPGADPAWHWLAEGELRLECFSDSPAFWQRLATVVEKTYVGSLDCPEVTGLRSAYETLQGYRQNTQWRPELWFLVRVGEEDIGCLLLGDRPQDDCLELVYMGLIPEYRGRAIGGWLVRQTKKQAILLGRSQIAAAVDVRNWPAIHAYEAAGFQSVGRADVYQRTFTPESFTPTPKSFTPANSPGPRPR